MKQCAISCQRYFLNTFQHQQGRETSCNIEMCVAKNNIVVKPQNIWFAWLAEQS